MSSQKTVVLFPEAAFGPALNCVGIAQALRDAGHRPVFVFDASFSGTFAAYGFEEHPVRMSPPAEEEVPGQFWKDFIAAAIPAFHLDAFGQIETYAVPIWESVVDSALYVEEQLGDVLAEIRPDLVCVDNIILFPATTRAGCPWVRIISSNEGEIRDENVPPPFSGLPAADRSRWREFEDRFSVAVAACHGRFNDFLKARGLDPYPPGQFFEPSPYLNLLLFPKALGYDRRVPLDPARFQYLEGCVRDEGRYEVPQFGNAADPLVYLSFGSLGCADIELMRRLMEVLGGAPYRLLANVGDHGDAYARVPPNVHMSAFYPQPAVIPHCDAVIHHGGNNTFMECLYHAKPSLVLPMCWDGLDNATRCDETGHGIALPRYEWSDADLLGSLERLRTDTDMAARLASVSAHMQANPGTLKAARLLDGLLSRQISR